MLIENCVNLLDGVEQGSDRFILIESVDKEGDILAHIYFSVPFFC